VRAKEEWLMTWIFPQLIRESIYVEIIIKNGKKLQKKIEKQREQDGSKLDKGKMENAFITIACRVYGV